MNKILSTAREHFNVCKQFTTSLISLTSSLIPYLIKNTLETGLLSNFITAVWELNPCSCFLWTRRFAVVQVNQVITNQIIPAYSLDKTDHLIQIRAMVTRGYSLSDLTSGLRRKTKKQANVQAKFLVGQGKQKETFCRNRRRINKYFSWLTIPYRETRKISQNMRATRVGLEKNN